MKTFSLRLLLTTLFVSTVLFSSAQIKVGPIAGLNLSNMSGDNDDDNAMKMGFHVGAMVDIGISDNFIVNPGVVYSLKGTQSDENSDIKLNASYIEIPILAKYRLESGLNFFAGPYIGLLMSAKVTDGDNDLDIKDQMESTDFGLNVGLGFDLESGLGFSAQYGMGLSSVAKTPEGSTEDVDLKNSNIGISVRYMFGGN
jgi:hypothetical protein